jgi:hypothetical protein
MNNIHSIIQEESLIDYNFIGLFKCGILVFILSKYRSRLNLFLFFFYEGIVGSIILIIIQIRGLVFDISFEWKFSSS